jgi:anti-anti-sigma factor
MTTPVPVQLTFQRGEVLVAALAGELDMSNVGPVGEQIIAEIGDHDAVLVDLSELAFMDSSGLAMLNRLAGHTIAKGRHLRIVAGVDTAPRRILEIINLGIPVDDTRAAAQAALALGGEPGR